MSTDERLQALENSVRMWQRSVVAIALLAVLGVVAACNFGGSEIGPKLASAAEEPKKQYIEHLRVRLLEIVNDKREVVASFVGQEQGAALLFMDRSGDNNELFLVSGPIAGLKVKSGSASLSFGNGEGFVLGRRDLEKERRAQKVSQEILGRNNKEEMEQLAKDLSPRPIITMGLTEAAQGGIVSVFNPLGKDVVSIQSNKANEGAIYLNDVNGRPRKAL